MATILIVDDHDAMHNGLAETVIDLGYQPRSCASGKDSLALLARERIDAVLFDLRMPGAVDARRNLPDHCRRPHARDGPRSALSDLARSGVVEGSLRSDLLRRGVNNAFATECDTTEDISSRLVASGHRQVRTAILQPELSELIAPVLAHTKFAPSIQGR